MAKHQYATTPPNIRTMPPGVPYPLDPTMLASTLDLLGSVWKKLPDASFSS